MDLLLVFAGAILIYAIYKQAATETTYDEILKKENQPLYPGDYNPYALNQYVEWKDRMFSADVAENDIYTKPAGDAEGIYGISEKHIKLNPVDVKTVVNTRQNLNL